MATIPAGATAGVTAVVAADAPASTAPTAPGVAVSPWLATGVLGMLFGLQPLTTDLYLPALPLLAADLHAGVAAAQATMSAMILAFGIAQLVWGPLADRFGRRPVLLAGIAIHVAASIGAALSPVLAAVVACRAVQGAGLAAAVVCARAMVRDLYAPHEGARVMSNALAGLGVIAILSPPLGGALAAASGWRAAFLAIGVIGAGLLAFLAWRWPETAPTRKPVGLRELAAQAATVLRHPGFVAYAGLVAATYGGLFVFLAGSGFVFIRVLGLSPVACGLAIACASVSYIAGTRVCRRWLVSMGMAATVGRGAFVTVAAGLAMLVLGGLDVRSAPLLIAAQALYSFGHGVHQPCGQTGAVGPFPRFAGVAAALAGFVQACVAFATGLALGAAMDGTVRPYALGVAAFSALTVTVAWTLVRQQALPRPVSAASGER
jgi:DHA1 family bicyclomycin/chloramphenicol resistance-like MFS transporter